MAFCEKHLKPQTASDKKRAFRTLIDGLGDIRLDKIQVEDVRDCLIEVGIDHTRTAAVVQGALRKAWKIGQG